ncbi:hypothetical protein ACGFIV_24640 [Sphaerisporangium sp. NPDC049003]|uniref:hypothetical protein n=1 Tax=Sphaerisporangium sp. NPDC049003 TaxID=3364517 RepID=UPI0037107720
MTTLSNPTLGLLIEIADQAERFGVLEVETLLMRADLQRQDFRPDRYYRGNIQTTQGLMRYWVNGAREIALEGNIEARRALLAFARLILEKTLTTKGPQLPGWVDDPSGALLGALSEALLADGYDLRWEGVVIAGDWEEREIGCYRLAPTDATPAPLGLEISALEADLASRGYTTVLEHYRDAVHGLTNSKYASANGDLRTTLEDLVTRLAVDHTGFARPTRANTGSEAINHMINGNRIRERDGGAMLRGLWQMIQTNGPHPGQTDADEARWRMQMVTATARFLLRHFPA